MKHALTLALGSALFFLGTTVVSAQSTAYWSQCADGASIVRCETYNCPKGDTNGDGRCTVADDTAQVTESRNDSFCANPPSGCGEVLYYADSKAASCAVRVKENGNNCNLYKAGNPNFSTVAPAATVTSTPKPTSTPISKLDTSPKPSATPKGTSTQLPKTGAELWVSIFLAALGMYGLYLYEKPRKDEE